MGWFWIAVPVVVLLLALVLAALSDRRARRRGHRLRGAASMHQVLDESVDRYLESDDQQMNQQRTVWSLARWFGGGF
jgi:hypothetical protein